MELTISQIFLLFLFYAFLGWLLEVILRLIIDRRFINRGFLVGPICPIYGIGALFMIFFLSRYMDDPIVLLVLMIVSAAILEYFTSYIMEKIFKMRWWDYSKKSYNINGRVCLDNLCAFGLMGCIVIYHVNPHVVEFLTSIDILYVNIVAIILLVVLIVDMIVSFTIIGSFDDLAFDVKKDNTEEITNKVKQILVERGGLYKRIVIVFDFRVSDKLVETIKENLKDNIKKVTSTVARNKKVITDTMSDFKKKIEKK